MSDFKQTKRELDMAAAAVRDPGAGSIGNLECRLADLETRFLDCRATSLEDLEARLETIRDVVMGMGTSGYLLHLVDAALADIRALIKARESE